MTQQQYQMQQQNEWVQQQCYDVQQQYYQQQNQDEYQQNQYSDYSHLNSTYQQQQFQQIQQQNEYNYQNNYQQELHEIQQQIPRIENIINGYYDLLNAFTNYIEQQKTKMNEITTLVDTLKKKCCYQSDIQNSSVSHQQMNGNNYEHLNSVQQQQNTNDMVYDQQTEQYCPNDNYQQHYSQQQYQQVPINQNIQNNTNVKCQNPLTTQQVPVSPVQQQQMLKEIPQQRNVTPTLSNKTVSENSNVKPMPTKEQNDKTNTSTPGGLQGNENTVSKDITTLQKFRVIETYNTDNLMNYCFNMLKCHKEFKRITKLYPKTEYDTINALSFHKLISGEPNIFVIVLTQYHLYGLFTEDEVPDELGETWQPNVSFIFEFVRNGEVLNPPTRYTSPVKKTYTFGNDPSAATIMFSNAFKVNKDDVYFFQMPKNLKDHNGVGGHCCGSGSQKEKLNKIVVCQLKE